MAFYLSESYYDSDAEAVSIPLAIKQEIMILIRQFLEKQFEN